MLGPSPGWPLESGGNAGPREMVTVLKTVSIYPSEGIDWSSQDTEPGLQVCLAPLTIIAGKPRGRAPPGEAQGSDNKTFYKLFRSSRRFLRVAE